jgi:hypothetical protein
MDKWECRDLGEFKEFLCMCITQKKKDIYLDQHDYLDKVLERFSTANAKSALMHLQELLQTLLFSFLLL